MYIYIYVYTYISICQRFSYKIVIFHCHAKDPAEPCTLKQDIDLSTCQKRCATSWICRKAEDGTSQIHWLNLLNDQIYCVYVYIYIPYGYLTVCHGKSPFLIGKPSINGPFSMPMLNDQRVYIYI